MMKPPHPSDEAERLAALRELDVLDSLPEPRFDELTDLVAEMLDVPIALISLVDEDRQWFKSRHGLDAAETPRDVAFCAHAILGDELFVVEDSRKDARFADNPLAVGAPHVRFYAGAPLITSSGHRIGTVCGIDSKPKKLAADKARFLRVIAHQVVAQLELRRQVQTRNQLLLQKDSALRRLESANAEIRDLLSVISHDLRAPALNLSGFAQEIDKGLAKIRARIDGQPDDTGTFAAIGDLLETDLQTALDFMARSNRQIEERIDAIMDLSRHSRSDLAVERTDLAAVTRDVLSAHSHEIRMIGANVEIEALPSVITSRLAVQIVIENLVGNAIRYRDRDRAFSLRISAVEYPDRVELEVADNGRGMEAADIPRAFVMFRRVGRQDTRGDGTGLALCRAIMNRLGGTIDCESTPGVGSTFRATFPLAAEAEPPALSKSA